MLGGSASSLSIGSVAGTEVLSSGLQDLVQAMKALSEKHEQFEVVMQERHAFVTMQLHKVVSQRASRIPSRIPTRVQSPNDGSSQGASRMASRITHTVQTSDDGASSMSLSPSDSNKSVSHMASKILTRVHTPDDGTLSFSMSPADYKHTLTCEDEELDEGGLRATRVRFQDPMKPTCSTQGSLEPPLPRHAASSLVKPNRSDKIVKKVPTDKRASAASARTPTRTEFRKTLVSTSSSTRQSHVLKKLAATKQKEVDSNLKRRNQLKFKERICLDYGHNVLLHGLASVVFSRSFDMVCAAVITINSIIIGIETEAMSVSGKGEIWMTATNHACSLFFLLEVISRYSLHGREFFKGEDKFWNVFDIVLVVFSAGDVIMETLVSVQSDHAGMVATFKVMKMLRIFRLFRVFRFFSELSLLTLMISDSLKSLASAIILLGLIIYVFAICFTAGAKNYLSEPYDPDEDRGPSLAFRFGSLSRSVDSLVLSILGGVSWGELTHELGKANMILESIFFVYIIFSVFSLLNIITGVFVENAVQTANQQREFLVAREQEVKESFRARLQDFFEEMDTDLSGVVTLEELTEHWSNPVAVEYFRILGIDTGDCECLFRLLDTDGSGELTVEEFLEGCMNLKGQAKSIDVHQIKQDLKAVGLMVTTLLNNEGLYLQRNGKTVVDWTGSVVLKERPTKVSKVLSFCPE